MKDTMKIVAALILFAGIGVVANVMPRNTNVKNNGNTDAEDLSGRTQVANPASQACEAFGYVVDIRRDGNDGGEIGYCVFPDGTRCEEWSFFKNECGADWKKRGVKETLPVNGTSNDTPEKKPEKKYAGCPEWVNCMPGFDVPKNNCYIPPGCEGYTQKAY